MHTEHVTFSVRRTNFTSLATDRKQRVGRLEVEEQKKKKKTVEREGGRVRETQEVGWGREWGSNLYMHIINSPVAEMATKSKEILIQLLNGLFLKHIVNPSPLIKSANRDILFFRCKRVGSEGHLQLWMRECVWLGISLSCACFFVYEMTVSVCGISSQGINSKMVHIHLQSMTVPLSVRRTNFTSIATYIHTCALVNI